jgi:hypothetical protein
MQAQSWVKLKYFYRKSVVRFTFSNHFPFHPTDRINRMVLRTLNEFFGTGNVYPEILTVASQIQKMGARSLSTGWTTCSEGLFLPSN